MLVFGDSRIFFVCTNAKKVTETGQNPYSLVTQRRKKAEIKTFLIKKFFGQFFKNFYHRCSLPTSYSQIFFRSLEFFLHDQSIPLNQTNMDPSADKGCASGA